MVYDPDETSILTQGQSRSWSGMTSVENLQVYGEAILEASKERLGWLKSDAATSRLVDIPSARGRYNNGIEPVIDVYTDVSVKEQAYLRPLPLLILNNAPYRTVWGYMFGLTPKGDRLVTFSRGLANDSYTYHVKWQWHPAAGELDLIMETEYYVSGHRPTPNENNRIYPKDENAWCKFVYNFSTTLILSDEVRDAINEHRVPPRITEQLYTQRVYESSYEYFKYTNGDELMRKGGNPATHWHGYVYPGPAPSWEYFQPIESMPRVDILGLRSKCWRTFAYEAGRENPAALLRSTSLSSITPSVKAAMRPENVYVCPNAYRDRGGSTVYSQLQDEAIETNRYLNTNLPMFLADLKNAVDDWNNLADQFRGNLDDLGKLAKAKNLTGKDLKMALQDTSNTFLPLKYGWYLTQQEAEMIGEKLTRLWEDVRLASEPRYLGPTRLVESRVSTDFISSLSSTQQTFAWRATILPEPNSFSGLFAFLDERSLWLNMKDAWDWIPYSFVVNWFSDLPNAVTNYIDFEAWSANYFPLEISRSYKLTGRISNPDLFESDEIFVHDGPIMKYFYRTWDASFDPPLIQSTEGALSDRLNGHWCELTSLIVQRL
jgi:hypothetical protein